MSDYFVRLGGDGDDWKPVSARNARAALTTLPEPGEVITRAEFDRRYSWDSKNQSSWFNWREIRNKAK